MENHNFKIIQVKEKFKKKNNFTKNFKFVT